MHTAAYAAVFKGVYLSTEGYGQKSVSVYQLTYFIGLLYRSFFTGWRITVVNFFLGTNMLLCDFKPPIRMVGTVSGRWFLSL